MTRRARFPAPLPDAARAAMRFAVPVALVAAMCAATPSAAERAMARNGLSVAGDASGFEVFTRAGFAGADYFCAAGDFARTHLNARVSDRVEIIAPPAESQTRPNRRSLVFALRPPRSGRNDGLDVVLLRPRSVGLSRTVAHAVNLCNIRERRRGSGG